MNDDSLQFVVDLAQQTGELLLTYFRSDQLESRYKPNYSVVTEADLAADRMILEAIQAAYPDDVVISEELQTTLEKDAPGIWVVDPLDGTSNFSQGLQYWGVSIARLVDGQPEVGAVYFPMLGELFSARQGDGAWLNGEPLVTPPIDTSRATFIFVTAKALREFEIKVRMKSRLLGAAAYDLCAVAAGNAALAIQARSKLWDIAAAWLVVQQAGAVIAPFEDNHPFPPTPGCDYNQVSFPLLVAASPEVAEMARKNIRRR